MSVDAFFKYSVTYRPFSFNIKTNHCDLIKAANPAFKMMKDVSQKYTNMFEKCYFKVKDARPII